MIFWCSVMAMAISVVKCGTNLLCNGDFEDIMYTKWFCNGHFVGRPCTLIASTVARGGNYSINVTERTAEWNGLAQKVNVIPGDRYNITAYIQILTILPGSWYHTVALMERCTIAGKTVNNTVALAPFVAAREWQEVAGQRKIAAGSVDCVYYVQMDATLDYLVDDVSVTRISTSKWEEWNDDTDVRIDQLRKADISIELFAPCICTNHTFDIELEQIRTEFAMGSAVSATKIVDPTYTKYQDVFYQNFEWGMLENALKWGHMEVDKGIIIEDLPMDAMRSMVLHGIKMRCHSVVPSVWDEYPEWVKNLSVIELRDALENRVMDVANLTKGICDEWDVNNALLHGDFVGDNADYERSTDEILILMNGADPEPRLFFTDFDLINGSGVTVAMKNQVLLYKASPFPIGGIGAHGHMKEIDYPLVKIRLDILDEAALPIKITEFSVKEQDENLKAQKLTNLMRIFFSHPGVKGVVLCGFWDEEICDIDAALFTGANLTANAAGRAYQDLFNTWRTHEFKTLTVNQVYKTRAFKGDYRLKAKYNGKLINTTTFSLTDAGFKVRYDVNSLVTTHTSNLTDADLVITAG